MRCWGSGAVVEVEALGACVGVCRLPVRLPLGLPGGSQRARVVVTTQITTGRGGGGGSGQGDVGGLLGSLGLGKYKGLFAREEVDLEALSCMTESDLQLMGIPMVRASRLTCMGSCVFEPPRRRSLPSWACKALEMPQHLRQQVPRALFGFVLARGCQSHARSIHSHGVGGCPAPFGLPAGPAQEDSQRLPMKPRFSVASGFAAPPGLNAV